MIWNINDKWNSKLAYAVGLITTDGSLSKDKRHIEFTSSDLQLVKTFKTCLSLNNKICRKSGSFTNKKSYRIQFGDVKLYRWLTEIGLTSNKTSRLGKICIPTRYYRDFLRGHIDGDGSIVTYMDRYASYKGKRYCYQRIYLTFYSSSLKHLRWIQESINYLLKIKGSLKGWKHRDRKVTLWKLRFAKNDSLRLLSWIYYKPNLPCLNRKRKIAELFLKK